MTYEITGHTRLTGLIGSPVAHSSSPQMHNEAFRLLGLDYAYLAFDISPDQLSAAVEGLKAIGIHGFNVTMPYKSAIIPYLDALTPAAELTGSVNTVYRDGDRYIGHTTDGIGYMQSVADAGLTLTGKKMTLLGAGGAATSICVQAALDHVASIDVFKRKNSTYGKMEAFCEKVTEKTGCPVHLYDIADRAQLKESLSNSAILTNATSVGMEQADAHSVSGAGKVDLHAANAAALYDSPIPDPGVLYPDLFVSDIIYHPAKTTLLKQAESIGCRTQNGMFMLLFQGAASFHCWTGQDMPIEAIRQKYFSRNQ